MTASEITHIYAALLFLLLPSATVDGEDLFGGGGTGSVVSVDGGVGLDWLDFSLFASAVWVDLSYSGDEAWTRDNAGLTSGTWRAIGDVANIENVTGAAGDDYLKGDAEANVFAGGAGADALSGGSGADRFIFDAALNPGNVDAISDFTAAIDKIVLDDAVFTAIGAVGVLDANAFANAAAATNASQRILYDAATGALYYDDDGDGANAAIHIANLSAGLALANSDFLIS